MTAIILRNGSKVGVKFCWKMCTISERLLWPQTELKQKNSDTLVPVIKVRLTHYRRRQDQSDLTQAARGEMN